MKKIARKGLKLKAIAWTNEDPMYWRWYAWSVFIVLPMETCIIVLSCQNTTSAINKNYELAQTRRRGVMLVMLHLCSIIDYQYWGFENLCGAQLM